MAQGTGPAVTPDRSHPVPERSLAGGGAGGLRKLDVVSLALVALIGLVHLPHPFEFDQATFVLGAQKMAAGAVLYRDYWDVKQPAIYLFYLAAGRLFGFHEVGIHLFELFYQLAFAVTLVLTLRRRLQPLAATLAPLLAVGLAYAVSGAWHLTQVEGLAGLPLYLTLWFALRAGDPDGGARHAALSGLFGTVVLMFKFVFLPIVVAIWGVAFLDELRTRRFTTGVLVRTRVVPAVLGLLLPLGAFVAIWSRQGLLPELHWTWFEFPARMLRERQGTRVITLFDGLSWFALRFAPLIGLAIPGVVSRTAEARLRAMLAAWALVGFAMVLMQRVSWWQYHYLLLVPPLGILAAIGIATLWAAHGPAEAGRRDRMRWAAALGLVALFSGPIVVLGAKSVLLVRDRLALDPAHRWKYQVRQSELYYHVAKETAFLKEPGSLPGPILVLDGPAHYYLSGRPSSRRRDGVLFLDHQTREEWVALTQDAAAGRPAYVFVEAIHLPLLAEPSGRAESLARLLSSRYREVRRSPLGVWYERRQGS